MGFEALSQVARAGAGAWVAVGSGHYKLQMHSSLQVSIDP
jgi:hypothetical protein